MPSTVRNWVAKNQDKVDSAHVEYDEWEPESPYSIWIYLSAGWFNEWTETHAIHEPTAKETLDQARKYIVKCQCQECLELIKKKEQA